MTTLELTRLLLSDVVYNRLQNKGLLISAVFNHVPQNILGPVSCEESSENKIRSSLRQLCWEIEQKHIKTLEDTVNRLNISPENLHQDINNVIALVFSDQVNWGRIATIISFSGVLAERCIKKEMPQLVPIIIDVVTQYFNSNLSSWIDENKGWAGVVTFHSQAPEKWWTLKNICGFAVGTVGILSLVALTTSHA